MSIGWRPQRHQEQSEAQVMFLPIEVARLTEQERRQEFERRGRWLAIIREQRQLAQALRAEAKRDDAATRRTGPQQAQRTGARY